MPSEMMRRANGDEVVDMIRCFPVSSEFPNGDDMMHSKIFCLVAIYAGTFIPYDCFGSLHLPIRTIVDLTTFVQVGSRLSAALS